MKETTDLTYTIVTIITVLLFALPLLYIIYRKRKQLTLKPKEIRKLFNHTLLLQILLGLFLYLTFLVFDGDIFGDLTSGKWFEVISIEIVWFYIIGLFYYIPSIFLMNLEILLIFFNKEEKTACEFKRNQKYVKQGLTILTFIFSLFFASCGVEQKKFDKNTWNDMDDIMYANRESMISDLIENHLRKGMTYKEVVELLGKPENYANIKSNTIGYEIMVDYGWDIDPVKGKTLYIELTNDSIVNDFKLEEWKR